MGSTRRRDTNLVGASILNCTQWSDQTKSPRAGDMCSLQYDQLENITSTTYTVFVISLGYEFTPMTVAVSPSHLLLSLTSLGDLGSPIVDRGLVASPNMDKESLCNLAASPNVDKDSLCILLSPIMNCGLLASPSMDKETINDFGSPIVDCAHLHLASSSVGKESLASPSVEQIILQQKVRMEDSERSCHISLKVSLNFRDK